MSFKQYRSIDLTLFIVMYAVCEFLVIKAATVWFDEPYSISIMLPLLLVVMIRWDKYSIINAIVYALLFVYFHKGSLNQYLIYLIGNLGFMATLLLVNKVGKEKITKTFINSMGYALVGFLTMELSRGLAAMIISGEGPQVIVEFILTNMLSLVFSIVVIFIVRRVDGLFMDQKKYLLEINSDSQEIDGGWQDE